MSAREALLAIEIVSKRCLGRKFNQLENWKENTYDQDTLPSIKAARDMVKRIEAQGLASQAAYIVTRKRAGEAITDASDSTTKKAVGQVNVAGIHVNKDKPLPLQVVPVSGEAK